MDSRTPNKPKPRFWEIPWVRRVGAVVASTLTGIGLAYGYTHLDGYARTLMAKQVAPSPAAPRVPVVLVNTPPWLSKEIVAAIAKDGEAFATATPGNKARLADPLDGLILQDLARFYTAQASHHQNAWIKQVQWVRRVRDVQGQHIELAAEFRKPVAMVAMGDQFCIIDHDAVRLPGDYKEDDRTALRALMLIRGIDGSVPAPGTAFKAPEAAAAIKLVDLLAGKPYAFQIAAINMDNYHGRLDAKAPHVLLDTTFNTVVWWGRPVDEEGFYNIPGKYKVEALDKVYAKYSRIDAGRAFVNIQDEHVYASLDPAKAPEDAEAETDAPAPAPKVASNVRAKR